jgi:hypothetical protein
MMCLTSRRLMPIFSIWRAAVSVSSHTAPAIALKPPPSRRFGSRQSASPSPVSTRQSPPYVCRSRTWQTILPCRLIATLPSGGRIVAQFR